MPGLFVLVDGFAMSVVGHALAVSRLRRRSASQLYEDEGGPPAMADTSVAQNANPPTAASADRFEARPTADRHFSWIRTRLSLERTMMAWLRTATALIGFGFAIVQYLNHLREIPAAALPTFPMRRNT